MTERSHGGFTLIELLTIVAIIGVMVSVAVVSFGSGQGAARAKGAARDIFASIRQARSLALVTQQPAIITYSEQEVDGEICAKVEITTTKIMSQGVTRAETLSGEVIMIGEEGDETGEGGETVEDILFAPIAEDVVRGVRIKVAIGDETYDFAEPDEEKAKAKISVFSNVDYLLGRYSESRQKAESAEKEKQDAASSPVAPSASAELQEKRSVVWEVNGRCEPHRVWIYREGTSPDKGLCIKVDRFGAAKILSGEEM